MSIAPILVIANAIYANNRRFRSVAEPFYRHPQVIKGAEQACLELSQKVRDFDFNSRRSQITPKTRFRPALPLDINFSASKEASEMAIDRSIDFFQEDFERVLGGFDLISPDITILGRVFGLDASEHLSNEELRAHGLEFGRHIIKRDFRWSANEPHWGERDILRDTISGLLEKKLLEKMQDLRPKQRRLTLSAHNQFCGLISNGL